MDMLFNLAKNHVLRVAAVCAVLCVLILALFSLAIFKSGVSLPTGTAHFCLQTGMAIATFGTFIFLIRNSWKSYKEAAQQSWWNIADNAECPTWDDIRCMVVGELKPKVAEPLAFEDQKPIPSRPFRWKPWFKLLAEWMILGCGLFLGLAVIADPTALPWFTDGSGHSEFLTKIISSPLPLFVASASAFFAFRQMQAQQKAKSRQEWLDKLRARMATTIALAEEYKDCLTRPHEWAWLRGEEEENGKRRAKLRHELTDARLELELFLNPSEKDHRLLMYLVQRLAMWDSGKGAEIEDQRFLIDSIKRESKYVCTCRPYPTDMAWCKIVHHEDFSQTVSYAMRLSHVILKREWERVKTTT